VSDPQDVPPGFAPTPPVDFDPPPPVPAPRSGSAAPVDDDTVVVQIGEIGVTSTMVHTPAGDIPLAGSTWQVAETWHAEQRTPTWAIVCSVCLFCPLLFFSLLFLLVKETVHRGTVQVTVTNGQRQYVGRIPVTDPDEVTHVHQQVNYVRSLSLL
jgi:hypothetical protein